MENQALLIGLAGILAAAAPVIFAVIGETINERSGVINLSVNGTILLTAMAGFAVAVTAEDFFTTTFENLNLAPDTAEALAVGLSLLLGFLAGMVIGGLVAAVIAFSSISLRQSQVAVGFVLTLVCRDLAYFLGNPYMGLSGPRLPAWSIPGLSQIPVIGTIFFRHDLITYLSFIVIVLAWLWIYKTRPGLVLQGVGERPAAAFVRGANINRQRYFYTVLGGALVGLAGPIYSLSVKAGWKGTISGLDGIGWIALAITIFGGWNPLRAAFGVYLFVLLQWLGLVLQPSLPGIPSQVLQVAPFPLMILALLLVNIGNTEWVDRLLANLPESTRHFIARLLRSLRASPPASLGVPFEQE